MSTFLRLFLIASTVFIAYMMITRPREIRSWGRKARLVALVYAAAIVISAVVRIAGWGT